MSTAPIGPPSGASVPPPLPPPKRNDAVLWILAIVGGGFVVLVLGGLLVASMFIRHVRVNQSGKQVEIETPAGALRVNGDQVHATGLPVYPGAQPDKSEGSTVELSAISGAGLGLATRKVRHDPTISTKSPSGTSSNSVPATNAKTAAPQRIASTSAPMLTLFTFTRRATPRAW